MDPEANLAEQERLVLCGAALTKSERRRLGELQAALGEWLARGGFEPPWSKYPAAAYGMRRRYPMNNSNTVTKDEAFADKRRFRR